MSEITIDKKEIEQLLEEFPTLKKFSSRMRTIALLTEDARTEKDPEFIKDSYETILRMQERLCAEIVTYFSQEYSNQFNEVIGIADERKQLILQLKGQIQEEQQIYINIHEDLCLCMLINPRYTFENIILKAVERKKKIESGNGLSNWQWELNFPLLARLRMAWKLIFGSREIPESSSI